MMICAGIPIKKERPYICAERNEKKEKTVASSDHIRQEIIKNYGAC